MKQGLMYIAYLSLSFLFTISLLQHVTPTPERGDAHQNARMGYNLAKYGVISYTAEQGEPITPTMRREPFPIAAIAAFILLHPSLSTELSRDEITAGSAVQQLKQLNIVWVFILFLGITALCQALFKPVLLSIAIAILLIAAIWLTFASFRVDRMLTELPAAALLVWTSWLLLRFTRRPTKLGALSVGVAFGLLTLTKASFLYVCPVAIVILMLMLRTTASSISARGAWLRLPLLTGLVFAAICSLWIGRNAYHFGVYDLAERGGDNLYFRQLFTEQPVLGVVYAFSPPDYRDWWGKVSGYRPEDLELGGRLAALGKGEGSIDRVRWDIYKNRMQEAGIKYEGKTKAQKWLANEALKNFFSEPHKYALWAGVFMYRGSFQFPDALARNNWPIWAQRMFQNVSPLLYLNFLVCGVVSILRGSPLRAVFLLPIGLSLFYAMFSVNHMRFNEPVIPFIWLAGAITLGLILQWLLKKFGSGEWWWGAAMRQPVRSVQPDF